MVATSVIVIAAVSICVIVPIVNLLVVNIVLIVIRLNIVLIGIMIHIICHLFAVIGNVRTVRVFRSTPLLGRVDLEASTSFLSLFTRSAATLVSGASLLALSSWRLESGFAWRPSDATATSTLSVVSCAASIELTLSESTLYSSSKSSAIAASIMSSLGSSPRAPIRVDGESNRLKLGD